MKALKVEYQVRPDFTSQNKDNIKKVMDALRDRNDELLFYASYYLGEGRFMHLAMAGNDFSGLNALKEFTEFQQALKESGPLLKPVSAELELVGISRVLF